MPRASRPPKPSEGAQRARRKSQLYVEPQLPHWWDWIVILLTIATLVALFVEWSYDLTAEVSHYVQWGDNLVCAIFISEFALRLRRAPRRLEFVRRNWIDLVGAIPTIDALRSVRVVRLVRLLRITRFFVVGRRMARRYDMPLPKGALTNLGLTTVAIWLASAFVFHRYERDVNESVDGFGDALWWSMTTLSTVGYGDLFPVTDEGRAIAGLTMVLGIGLLGAVAATTAASFIELRDRGNKGLRRQVMRDHLLVLGWNTKGPLAIENFRNDPRHAATSIIVVAESEQKPIDDPEVRFVRGSAAKASVLEKASAADAGAAIVLACRAGDPRSDHESALVVATLRRLNPNIRIGVELVDPADREHLENVGCDAIIDGRNTIANLLVRAVQDVGVAEVVHDLVETGAGSELYRVGVADDLIGRTYADYAKHMIDRRATVVGIARGDRNLICPPPDLVLVAEDDAFVVAREPPAL
jgi:voltage-gated potassium channel